MAADIQIGVAQDFIPASNGATVDFVDAGFNSGRLPKAAIFFGGYTGTVGTTLSLSIGFTDGVTSQTVAVNSVNGKGTMTTIRNHSTTRVFTALDGNSNGVSLGGTFVQFLPDGVRVQSGNVTTGVNRLCNVVLIGGDDVNAKAILKTGLDSGTADSVTGIGFEASVLFGISAVLNTSSESSTTANNVITFGTAVNDIPLDQRTFLSNDQTGVSVAVCGTAIADGICRMGYSGLDAGIVRVTGFNADGFDLDFIAGTTSVTNRYVSFLALEFLNGGTAEIVDFQFPSAGNVSVPVTDSIFGLTSVSEPSTVLDDPVEYSGLTTGLSIGTFTATDTYSTTASSKGAVGTSLCSTTTTTDISGLNPVTGAINLVSTVAITPTAFDFTVTTHPPSARNAWCLSISDGGAPAGAVLDTPTVTAIAQTTATIGCTTDTAGGTLYWTVTESATATAADIKAGTGVDSGNFVPGGTGPQTVGATGLTADTAYYHHWVQVT